MRDFLRLLRVGDLTACEQKDATKIERMAA
jgi:hypothetical protein